MESPYKSALGKAIDYSSRGLPLPQALIRELRDDQGMSAAEILLLRERHAPKNLS